MIAHQQLHITLSNGHCSDQVLTTLIHRSP